MAQVAPATLTNFHAHPHRTRRPVGDPHTGAVSDGWVRRWWGVGRWDGLTDGQWALVEPLLPERARRRRGGRSLDRRAVIDAVAWKHERRCAWWELPERFGPWRTVYHRYTVWGNDGTWHRILTRLQHCPDPNGNLDWLIEVDAALGARAAGARGERGDESAVS
ncbi:transposase [Embleya sp. NPDC059237]|uniref:transposase n=1 Tax=Embleya sp. NPDC059237 TaxID=3346784 RepID=UPI0036BE8F92